jgi:hypothetical protein
MQQVLGRQRIAVLRQRAQAVQLGKLRLPIMTADRRSHLWFAAAYRIEAAFVEQ